MEGLEIKINTVQARFSKGGELYNNFAATETLGFNLQKFHGVLTKCFE